MMKLFDTNIQNIELPNIKFPSTIFMPSADFQKICRNFSQLAEKLEITSTSSDLIFRCIGDFVDGEAVILSDNDADIKVEKLFNNSNTTAMQQINDIVQGVFELKYLILFTKCTNLCSTIQINLKNDCPLSLKYEVSNLGEVRLILAPQKQKSDTMNKH
jgi:proliferating cell nuclear antigen